MDDHADDEYLGDDDQRADDEYLYVELYSESGQREQHTNLFEFSPVPDDPLALKWNDDEEPARWVTSIRDLQELRNKHVELSYTSTGLMALGIEPDLNDI